MNGAKALLTTLLNADIDVCFSNPGTSEMHFIAALDQMPGMRCVLCLFEGVATGAADGYARMAGKPAATLLHLGPGLGNGLANLHNAKRGNTPVVNIVGDHASYHLRFNAPLTSDVEGVAAPMSHWVKTAGNADAVAREGAEAVAQARRHPGHVATLILPADTSWGRTTHYGADLPPMPPAARVPDSAVSSATQALQSGDTSMLLLGGTLSAERIATAARIARKTGARLACETLPARIARGQGVAEIERLPYLPEWAAEYLKDLKHVVLVGASAPVSFFAYPLLNSELLPASCRVHQLSAIDEDTDDALARLAEAVAADIALPETPLEPPALPQGPLNTTSIAQCITAQLPEHAVIVDEGIIGGSEVFPMVAAAPRHEWIIQGGGSIGWGLPAAVGAAIACPDRKVICLEGDGSAMYTNQALWTMAREKLDVTTIIFANRQYAILQMEFMRVGAKQMGDNASSQMSLGNPDINYVELANSMGVHATSADSAEAFNQQFAAAMSTPGPHLIEAII